jgi:hypothetical protein
MTFEYYRKPAPVKAKRLNCGNMTQVLSFIRTEINTSVGCTEQWVSIDSEASRKPTRIEFRTVDECGHEFHYILNEDDWVVVDPEGVFVMTHEDFEQEYFWIETVRVTPNLEDILP